MGNVFPKIKGGKKLEKVMVRAVGFDGKNCIMGLVGFDVLGIVCDFPGEHCLGRSCWPFYVVSRRTGGSKILKYKIY